MLHVLERFELESADGGHGAFFPDSQPQLLTHGVSEGLGSSLFLRPGAVHSRGVLLCSQGQGQACGGGGRIGRGLKGRAVTRLLTLPGDPSYTSMQLVGFWGGASLVECALRERLASGRVFPMRALRDHGNVVSVSASVTSTEASATVWVGMTPCLSLVKGSRIPCPGKRKNSFPPQPVLFYLSPFNSVRS